MSAAPASSGSSMCTKKENRYEIDAFGQTIHLAHKLPSGSEMQAYAERGIRLVVSDVDSTLTDGHEGSVCSDADEMVHGAYGAGMRVAVVSNNPDRRFVFGVAERLGVTTELTFSPQSMLERKPSLLMIKRAINQAGVLSHEALGIGDGMTDMVAFSAAGIRHSRLQLARPEEVGGYPLRSEVRSIVHGLGRIALPHLEHRGVARRL